MTMNRSGGAAKLPEERKALAVRALAGSESVTALADEEGVSRKFVYAQAGLASAALDGAFPSAANDGEPVLFEWKVTPPVVKQIIVALALICRASYRGIIEFMRDVMGWAVSLGTVHNVLAEAARRASVINSGIELSAVQVGLHDEI